MPSVVFCHTGREVCATTMLDNDAIIANTIRPFTRTHKNLAAYLARLMARASYSRVLKEAQPYFELFPMEKKPQLVEP